MLVRAVCALILLLATSLPVGAEAWIVRPRHGVSESVLLAQLGQAEVLARGRASNLLLLDLPVAPPALWALSWAERDRPVQALDVSGAGGDWIQPVTRLGLDDPLLQGQPAFEQIDVSGLQAMTDGSGILVALIDSGVDLEHSDPILTDSLDPGWDYIDDDAYPDDAHGHGTRVAGLVVGVMQGVRILPLRVLDSQSSGTVFAVSDSIEYAADMGADIINLSLGTTYDSQALRDSVAYARTKGAAVVAAAGNDDSSTPYYPAAIPEVIAVAGVDGSDVRADFADPDDGQASNFGNWVDLCSPAIDLETTSWPDPYVQVDGTSAATAVVSATLAGELAVGKSREEAESDLLTSSVNVDAANPGFTGLLGSGRLVASSAAQ